MSSVTFLLCFSAGHSSSEGSYSRQWQTQTSTSRIRLSFIEYGLHVGWERLIVIIIIHNGDSHCSTVFYYAVNNYWRWWIEGQKTTSRQLCCQRTDGIYLALLWAWLLSRNMRDDGRKIKKVPFVQCLRQIQKTCLPPYFPGPRVPYQLKPVPSEHKKRSRAPDPNRSLPHNFIQQFSHQP